MGSVYSLFPSGYVQPTKTTTIDQIVDMSLDEQASFASKSVITRADDSEFVKKLLEMSPPEPITAEYLATLAAVIKTGGQDHMDALREKYFAAGGKHLALEQKDASAASSREDASAAQHDVGLVSEQKDISVPQKDTGAASSQKDTGAAETPTRINIVAVEKIVERYVNVHYCPNCGKVYRGTEEDDEESSSESTLSNSLD